MVVFADLIADAMGLRVVLSCLRMVAEVTCRSLILSHVAKGGMVAYFLLTWDTLLILLHVAAGEIREDLGEFAANVFGLILEEFF